jgi:hypothetical protein
MGTPLIHAVHEYLLFDSLVQWKRPRVHQVGVFSYVAVVQQIKRTQNPTEMLKKPLPMNVFMKAMMDEFSVNMNQIIKLLKSAGIMDQRSKF